MNNLDNSGSDGMIADREFHDDRSKISRRLVEVFMTGREFMMVGQQFHDASSRIS